MFGFSFIDMMMAFGFFGFLALRDITIHMGFSYTCTYIYLLLFVFGEGETRFW